MKWHIMVVGVLCSSLAHGQTDRQGIYFAKKSYQPSPLPGYEAVRDLLPSPVFDENPLLVETYWKAWELASRHFHEPAPGSGYVSQFIDAAFNKNIFLWDTAFMSMFCNAAYGLVPASHPSTTSTPSSMKRGRFAGRLTEQAGRILNHG